MIAKYFGFNPAFYGGPNNILSRQEDEQLIKNDLLQLLNTIPGERVYRPTFGTALRSSLFEPIDNNTLYDLRHSMINAINVHEPRVSLVSLDLSSNEAQNQIQIKLVVQIREDLTKYITIDYLVNGRQ
jgi:phage baseplate assembly protein W